QIIRRSRRPLLRGLEQARRSAVAHHVYRIASMGARVLINGTRYYSGDWPRAKKQRCNRRSRKRLTTRVEIPASRKLTSDITELRPSLVNRQNLPATNGHCRHLIGSQPGPTSVRPG